jgi:hypothetical protein
VRHVRHGTESINDFNDHGHYALVVARTNHERRMSPRPISPSGEAIRQSSEDTSVENAIKIANANSDGCNEGNTTMPRGYTGVTDKQTDKAVKRGQRGRFTKGTKAGPGRPKGLLNKFTGDLKEGFLQAAQAAGGSDGIAGYL